MKLIWKNPPKYQIVLSYLNNITELDLKNSSMENSPGGRLTRSAKKRLMGQTRTDTMATVAAKNSGKKSPTVVSNDKKKATKARDGNF